MTIAGTGYGESGYEAALRMGITIFSGNIALSGNATIGTSGASTASGAISGGSNLTVGTSSLTGTLSLTGANTYTGGTTIAYGALSIGSGGSINVGAGTAGVTVASGAKLLMSAGGTLTITSASATIANSGTVNLTGGSLNLNHLFDSFNGGASGTYTLITGTAGAGAATVLTSGYNAGVWSSVTESAAGVLTFTAVPEPSTYGLIGAGALAAVAVVRRRRKVV